MRFSKLFFSGICTYYYMIDWLPIIGERKKVWELKNKNVLSNE